MTTATPITRTGSMVPEPSALPDVLPTDRLNARGMPTASWRGDLRKIPNARNVVAVLATWGWSFGVMIGAAAINTWWSYLAGFVLLARGHVCLSILAHEAAHRLLFSNRAVNDFVGRWGLGYPALIPTMAYRRSHFAHHRDELGPEEPDLALYAGYPIARDSWHRKLRRDITGVSGAKVIKGLFRAARSGSIEARQIIAVQLVILGVSIVFMRPLAYVIWIGSWITLWRVSNRLRAIAEHGGMVRSKDRRMTTHVIRQTWIARFWFVPYNTGWHLAHHADMGVPWTKLPRLHDELVRSGWVTEDIVYPSYWAFWRTVSSRPPVTSDTPTPPG
ncbi:MAG: fatty acid desaturase [Ilumatobacteraceae bacterium]|nr:fatty acid desaturase [Ilumatobacteraceae bacterium]